MSERGWRHYPHIGVALFALVAFIGTYFLEQYQDFCRNSDYPAQQQLTCSNYNALAIVTPEANPNPSREEWRIEKDLQAQREMALWTMVMAGISGAGLIITAIGIVLVWKTLSANRAAVGAAYDAIDSEREIGEAQTRAYISVTSLHVGFDENEDLTIQVQFENFGQSPALKAEYTLTAFFHKRNGKSASLEERTPGILGHIGAGQVRTNQVTLDELRPTKKMRKSLFSKSDTGHILGLNVHTSFYDVFGNHFLMRSGFIIRAYGFKPDGKLAEMEPFGDDDASICEECQKNTDYTTFFPKSGRH